MDNDPRFCKQRGLARKSSEGSGIRRYLGLLGVSIISKQCNTPLTDDNGRRTLYEDIQVPQFLQTNERGIFGSGRDIRRDSTGTAGSLRGVDSSLPVEGVSLQSFGIAVVEGTANPILRST